MTNAELSEMRCAIDRLRSCVETIRIAGGDSPAIRRLLNEVDRIQWASASMSVRAPAQEIVPITESPYDRLLWHGADDEGIGGNRR